MIILYGGGKMSDLAEPSPFVRKAGLLLRLAGLAFKTETKEAMRNAPRGKIPYIDDEGEIISDSTIIRFHIENKYNFDFDKGLNKQEKAIGWAFQKMFEEHLYFLLLEERWMDKRNFKAGPKEFFNAAPAFIRRLVIKMIMGNIKKTLHLQGTSRLSIDEKVRIYGRAMDSVSDFLGDKKFMFGDVPTATDATVFAFIETALWPRMVGPIKDETSARANLLAYNERCTEYFS